MAFTICSNNYFAQALALGNSLIEHNPDYVFKIGLVDKKNERIKYDVKNFEVIEVEKIDIGDFDNLVRRYNIVELNTAVKPFYFKYLFSNYKDIGSIIYLDPDILVYSSFNVLDEILNESQIVITPHFTNPITDDKWQAEEDFLNSGLYNLGFIALNRGKESDRFLEWWAIRLERKAYIDPQKGLFTDQIWINFVPLFFDKVHILNHAGYNMAYWNLHERILINGHTVFKNNLHYPLVFYHFSGFDPLKADIISKYQNRYSFNTRPDLVSLFKHYSETLFNNGYSKYKECTSYYTEIKKTSDLEDYLIYKRSIPIHKRFLKIVINHLTRLLN